MIFAQYLLFIRAIPQNLAQSHEYYLKPNVWAVSPAAKYYCAFLKTLKIPQCPYEFTTVLQGKLGHSMGILGLKITDLAYMFTL